MKVTASIWRRGRGAVLAVVCLVACIKKEPEAVRPLPLCSTGLNQSTFVPTSERVKLSGCQTACDHGNKAACTGAALLLKLNGQHVSAAGHFETLCSADGDACFQLGFMYQHGQAVSVDNMRAIKLFSQSCDMQSAAGCNALAEQHLIGYGKRAESLPLFERSCAKGYGAACVTLARLKATGQFSTADVAGAERILRENCAKHVESACYYLGLLLRDQAEAGVLPEKNYASAATLLGDECRSNNAAACDELGILLANGLGVASDLAQAKAAFLLACNGGYSAGCYHYGSLQLDTPLAMTRLEGALAVARACQPLAESGASHADACRRMGQLYEAGTVVAKDKKLATAYFKAGCDVGSYLSCEDWARVSEPGSVEEAVGLFRACLRGQALAATPEQRLKVAKICQQGGIHAAAAERLDDAAFLLDSGCALGLKSACFNRAVVEDSGGPKTAAGSKEVYKRLCADGEMLACVNLGVRISETDPAQSESYYQKACTAGVGVGCLNLGLLLNHAIEKTQVTPTTNEAKRAAVAFESACTLGTLAGCFMLGDAREEGLGLPADTPLGVSLYRKATRVDGGDEVALASKHIVQIIQHWETTCQAGNMMACKRVGVAKFYGFAVGKDVSAAANLFEKACKSPMSVRSACDRLGTTYAHGRGRTLDAGKAAEAFKLACDAGHQNGCVSLGLLLELGRGVTANLAAAKVKYKSACDQNYAKGCAYLGRLQQKAGQADEALKNELAACDAMNGAGCWQLGLYYQSGGFGGLGTKDNAKAAKKFEEGCELGESGACVAAARHHLSPQGGANGKLGRRFLERACEEDDAVGCHELGKLLSSATGLASDTEKGSAYLRRSCELEASLCKSEK